jgi:NSS family neurotransmitter:Na+ symporter
MNQIREHWGSKLGFLMAAVGSAIGLGILWKFPYVAGQNGGGLFFLCYLGFLLLIGIPVFLAELILGRSSQRAAVGAFGEESGWRVAGWLGVASSFLIMSYYSVIAGYGMSYILMSLSGFYNGLDNSQIPLVYERLSSSGPISLFWHLAFTLITAGIVFSGVRKGIETWSKILVKIFLVLLLALFCYSLTLPGFRAAFEFVIQPHFGDFKPSSALQALGLAFFTMSLGQGIMISYGSYMKKGENVVRVTWVVGLSVIVVAALAALTIFPVVFSFGLSPQEGPGLVFKTLPYLFSKLPGSMVLSTLFFTLFVFTALTSAVPLIEVVATNIMELTGLSRKKATALVASLTFIVGIPSAFSESGLLFKQWSSIFGMNYLETMDHLVTVWIIPFAGLLTALFVGWKMDARLAESEFVTSPIHYKLFKVWKLLLKYIVPLLMIFIILHSSGIIDIDRLFLSQEKL